MHKQPSAGDNEAMSMLMVTCLAPHPPLGSSNSPKLTQAGAVPAKAAGRGQGQQLPPACELMSQQPLLPQPLQASMETSVVTTEPTATAGESH